MRGWSRCRRNICDGLTEAVSDGELWKLWYTFIPKPEDMRKEIDRRLGPAGGRLDAAVHGVRCRRQDRGHDDLHERRCRPTAASRSARPGTPSACSAARLNTQCKLLLLTHAFEKLGCIAVEFRTHFFNHQSRRGIERLGAKQDGILRNHTDRAERHVARHRGLQHHRQRMADGEGASRLSTQREGAVAPRQKRTMETFDYVIIGAGSAGSVLANRLSEDAGTSVCVLEAGPRDWHPYIHLPAGFIKTFHMKSINWAYQQEVGPWTGGRSIYAPRGKTLGGSSSINGHIYNRGQRQDFDTWAQLGNRGWGYPDVLPYFKRLERRVGEGDETYRGRDGNLTVTTMDWQDPLCEALHGRRHQPRHSAQPRLQRRDPGGRVLRPAHHSKRPARQRGDGVPASGAEAAERPCPHACACHQHHLRGQARGRRALSQGRQGRRPRSRCAPARKSSCPAAPTTRRRCCNCPASARRNCCNRSASRCATRCPASARACRIITRRARSRASRTSRPSTNSGAD